MAQYLDPVVLAYLIMMDGNFDKGSEFNSESTPNRKFVILV